MTQKTLQMLAFVFLLIFTFVGGSIVGTKFGHDNDSIKVSKEQNKNIEIDKSAETKTEDLSETTSKAVAEKVNQVTDDIKTAATKALPKKEIIKPLKVSAPKTTEKKSTKKPAPIRGLAFMNKSRKGYTVLTASYEGESNANNHAKRIKEKHGLDAFYYTQTIKNKRWFRVGVGAFTMKGTAEGLKKHLEKTKVAKNCLISKIK